MLRVNRPAESQALLNASRALNTMEFGGVFVYIVLAELGDGAVTFESTLGACRRAGGLRHVLGPQANSPSFLTAAVMPAQKRILVPGGLIVRDGLDSV